MRDPYSVLGVAKSVTVIPPGATVEGIVRIAAFTALQSLELRGVR